MDKVYKIEHELGKGKYFFRFHDSKTKRPNGQPFWHVRIFRDKKKLNDFEKTLRTEGYTYYQPKTYKRVKMKKHKAMDHTFFALSNKVNSKNFKTFLSHVDKPNQEFTDEELEAKIYFIRELYGKYHCFKRQMGLMTLLGIGREIDQRLLKRIEDKKALAFSVPTV